MASMTWATLLIASVAVLGTSAEFFTGGHFDKKNAQITDDASGSSHVVLARTADEDDLDLIAEESVASVASTAYPDQEPRYKLPYAFAFNGGKPFSLEKDPITGKIDFEKTPPLKALNLTDSYQNDEDSVIPAESRTKLEEQYPYSKISYLNSKRVNSGNSKNERVGPNEINPYSPSFHDFLNLPIRYSSEKYERDNHPLISSSYANTKVQSGSNSYNINNHRPYHQETATKVSISTATRKVYYPKSTSTSPTSTTTTTTTTTTTIKPKTTTSTTTTTTRPIEKITTIMMHIKASTTVPNTAKPTTITTQSSITPLKITTWKPPKSSSHYDEYESVLPIEMLQSIKNSAPNKIGVMMNKELNGHNNGPQSPSNVTSQPTYLYNDDYEEYDSSSDNPNHHDHHQQLSHDGGESIYQVGLGNSPTASSTKSPLSLPSTTSGSSAATASTTTTTTTTTMRTTKLPAQSSSPMPNTGMKTSTSGTSTLYKKEQPSLNIHLTTAKPGMLPVYQQLRPPVTSMPLDSVKNPLLFPPVHENFVETHRPVEYYNNNNNNNNNNIVHSMIHFGPSTYNRPGSVISVLPESTSNVIVPHDQDTVSFVLGNRQNVEGSYYTLGSAMEEHPYAPSPNGNNFRPMFSSGSNTQEPKVDEKVSVALPSMAAIEQSPASEYNPSKWYNSNSMLSSSGSDNEAQAKPQSSFVFASTPSNDNNNNSQQNDTAQRDKASGYITFPNNDQDKQSEEPQGSVQRPIEEHVVVINQADGSIKELAPNGLSNPVENSAFLSTISNGSGGNSNTNNNNSTRISNNSNDSSSISDNNNNNSDNIHNNNYGSNGLQNLPQLSESLTPPAESRPSRIPAGGISQRPPYYFHYQHGNVNSGKPLEYPPRPQRIPLPPRQKLELPSVGFKRRTNTPHDVKLPNILPQFRPNAKTSHGHRGADKIGTLSAPLPQANRPRPLVSQPLSTHLHPTRRGPPYPTSHLQRLSPPPLPAPGPAPAPLLPSQQQQLPRKTEVPTVSKPELLNRYRPQPVSGNRPNYQKLRMEDEPGVERFSAEPPEVPPRPIIFPKSHTDGQIPKVATLQMIQQRGTLDEDIIRSNLPPLFKISHAEETKEDGTDKEESSLSIVNNEADRRKDNEEPGIQEVNGVSETGPVYVVYPVNSAVNIGNQEDNTERDESVVIGTRGPHRPLPPDTLSHYEDDQGVEQKYDETKLSDFYYGNRPQHQNAVNSDFSSQNYNDRPESSVLIREKPVLVPSDDADDEDSTITKTNKINGDSSSKTNIASAGSSSNTAFNVISYLQDFLPFPTKKSQQQQQQQQPSTISATLPRLPSVQASSPIAFVYTPTTPSAINREEDSESENDELEEPELFERHRDEKPVLLPSQQPSSSSSSAPSPQSFMAPFVASLSAEAPARNGWNVVANATERTAESRSDIIEDSAPSTESQTESAAPVPDNFDSENFKPQLFGGFKPIYDFPVEDDEHTPMVGRSLATDSGS